jgi:hypothetical protein
VLTAELEEAQATGNEDATKALQKIWELVLRLTEESLPPHVRLLNRLMSAEDEETIDKLLQANRPLVTAQFAEVVEKMVSNMEEGEEVPPEAIERMKQVLPKVKALVGEGGD